MISIQYLTYFMKICETHSMNKAASELYISQPALSLAVAITALFGFPGTFLISREVSAAAS